MPYYVYRVFEHPESKANLLTQVAIYPDYRGARERVREERLPEIDQSKGYCRLIHAKSETEAERLLITPRDERVIGEDS